MAAQLQPEQRSRPDRRELLERIPQDAALRLQLAAIAGGEPDTSLIELRPLKPDGRPAPADRAFVPVREIGEAMRRIREQAPRLNAYVGAAPRVREDGTAAAVARVWTLWTDLDGPDALERLRDFRPLPSIVVLTGSGGGHAWWPLRESVPPEWARLANRRLAHRLGGDLHATDPARVLRPCGTLNHKHQPPRPAVCCRLEIEMFTVAQVVRGLVDDRPYTAPVRPRSAARGEYGGLLDGLVRTVEQARVGERNASLFWSACRAAEHVAADELDAGEAYARLRNAALSVGLAEREIEATLRSASATVGAAA